MKWMIITLRLGTHFMAQLAGDLSKVTSWEEGSREGQGAEARSQAVEGLTGSLIQFAWLDTQDKIRMQYVCLSVRLAIVPIPNW